MVVFGIVVLLGILSPALASSFTAEAVGVTDGDTITDRSGGSQLNMIRLAGVDAPEHGQAFASESTEHLQTLVLGKDMNLDCGGASYGRFVCKVLPHHTYHWPGCPNHDDISPSNRIQFPNAAAADQAGYRAARNCP